MWLRRYDASCDPCGYLNKTFKGLIAKTVPWKTPSSQALVQICTKNSFGLHCRCHCCFGPVYKKSEALQNVSRYEITGGLKEFHGGAEESISEGFFVSLIISSHLLASLLKYLRSMQTHSPAKVELSACGCRLLLLLL